MAAAPVSSAAAAAAADSEEEDPIWTDLVDWLARFPGGTGVEEKVRLIHNQGATRSLAPRLFMTERDSFAEKRR
jgi:hypothetical protein